MIMEATTMFNFGIIAICKARSRRRLDLRMRSTGAWGEVMVVALRHGDVWTVC